MEHSLSYIYSYLHIIYAVFWIKPLALMTLANTDRTEWQKSLSYKNVKHTVKHKNNPEQKLTHLNCPTMEIYTVYCRQITLHDWTTVTEPNRVKIAHVNFHHIVQHLVVKAVFAGFDTFCITETELNKQPVWNIPSFVNWLHDSNDFYMQRSQIKERWRLMERFILHSRLHGPSLHTHTHAAGEWEWLLYT